MYFPTAPSDPADLNTARSPWRSYLPAEKSAHLTLKINLPAALLRTPDAAIAHAREVAAAEAERWVRVILTEGLPD